MEIQKIINSLDNEFINSPFELTKIELTKMINDMEPIILLFKVKSRQKF